MQHTKLSIPYSTEINNNDLIVVPHTYFQFFFLKVVIMVSA